MVETKDSFLKITTKSKSHRDRLNAIIVQARLDSYLREDGLTLEVFIKQYMESVEYKKLLNVLMYGDLNGKRET